MLCDGFQCCQGVTKQYGSALGVLLIQLLVIWWSHYGGIPPSSPVMLAQYRLVGVEMNLFNDNAVMLLKYVKFPNIIPL